MLFSVTVASPTKVMSASLWKCLSLRGILGNQWPLYSPIFGCAVDTWTTSLFKNTVPRK